jgi:glycosyltransferase involved in cell wall biosynthesis
MEYIPKMAEVNGLRISVVIPAYNEAKNLPYVLPLIPDWVHEVILIDGHSADDTVEVAQHLLPTIKVMQQTRKGKGNALRCGFAASTGDIIVMIDADGSIDPQEMRRFIEVLLAGADFAKGSRFIGDGGSADITPLRKIGNHMLSTMVNYLFRLRFTDLCYGYNAFWKDCLDSFEVDCEGFEVETLMSLRACQANLVITEVPSYEHARIYGASHLRTFRDGWRVLMVIMKEWMNGHSVSRTIKVHHPYLRENIVWDGMVITKQGGGTQ